jgi:hypothetical protein
MPAWQTLSGHPVLRLQAIILIAPASRQDVEKKAAERGRSNAATGYSA